MKAKGFEHSFGQWWLRIPKISDIDLERLPQFLPCLEDAELLFQEFQLQFRKLEQWHIKERSNQLKSKYKDGLKQLYGDLRPPMKDTPEVFWEDQSFTVMEYDTGTGMIQLEPEPTVVDDAVWLIHGQHVQFYNFEGNTCAMLSDVQVDVGDCVKRRIFTSNVKEVHEKLCDFWQARWQKQVAPSESDWRRITQFIEDFVPQGQCELGPITRSEWRSTAQRMKTQAARGSDGFSRLDMLRMMFCSGCWAKWRLA